MKHEFRLADIGEGLEEAEIVEWRVEVGDVVERDQPLIEIMTDKSNAELPAPTSGTVIEVLGAPGDIVTVGELIAVIDDRQSAHLSEPTASLPRIGDVNDADVNDTDDIVEASESEPEQADPSVGTDAGAPARVKASPSTRRAAAARGIDLREVIGSGPGGRVLLSDLDAAPPSSAAPSLPPPLASPVIAPPAPGLVADPPPPAGPIPTADPPPSFTPPVSLDDTPTSAAPSQPAGPVVALRGVRRAIAQSMTQSWTTIPHIHAFEHIDAEPLMELRHQLRESGRPGYAAITPLAFFVAAVASALRAHPEANASIDMDAATITRHPSVNVGVAVAAPQGLVVPVLHSAETRPLDQTAMGLHDLVSAARSASLGPERYRDGTVTVTNFGSLGGEQATPLIRPPEAMIFGFGSLAERPFVIDGNVVARKTMHLVAAADHRLLDGDITTAVLGHIAHALTHPVTLLIEP